VQELQGVVEALVRVQGLGPTPDCCCPLRLQGQGQDWCLQSTLVWGLDCWFQVGLLV
jgi:hypothetical protein